MPEAITKYALNSTLGTDEFQPLDKMIVGQKMFVAGDTPIYADMRSLKNVTNYYRTFLSFTPELDGTLKISLFLQSFGDSSAVGDFRIREGSKIVYVESVKDSNNVETIINISAKKTYKFECKAYIGASVLITNFKISGSIVDRNWFKIESYEIE